MKKINLSTCSLKHYYIFHVSSIFFTPNLNLLLVRECVRYQRFSHLERSSMKRVRLYPFLNTELTVSRLMLLDLVLYLVINLCAMGGAVFARVLLMNVVTGPYPHHLSKNSDSHYALSPWIPSNMEKITISALKCAGVAKCVKMELWWSVPFRLHKCTWFSVCVMSFRVDRWLVKEKIVTWKRVEK